MLIGLTGGIGSGKSLAGDFFKSKNIEVIDADDLAHNALSKNGKGYIEFLDVFGETFLDENSEIDRKALREYIFKNPEMKNRLEEIDFVAGKYAGNQAIHRDFHDYNGYLYAVCDENSSSLQIMDLSYLPDSVHLVYDSDSLIIRAHNIFIDTANAKLYGCAVATSLGFHALSVYDLSNPVYPELIYNYDEVGHVHDAYVYNDTAFLNCGNDGLRVIKSHSQGFAYELSSLTVYPDKGYNHSGWISGDKKTYIMCDETPSMKIKVLLQLILII